MVDDIFRHCDLATEAVLQGPLEELLRGRTALVVTTRKEMIEAANSVVVLVAGQVVAQKPYAELLQDGEIAELLGDALGFDAAAGGGMP